MVETVETPATRTPPEPIRQDTRGIPPTMDHGGLTVFLPVYNEADVIEEVVDAFYSKVVAPASAQLLVCEDGSTDRTGEVLQRLALRYPMRLERGPERKGYAGAVGAGLQKIRTPYTFFADSDGQYYPQDFWQLVPYANEYDLVIGRKVERDEPLHRIVLSKGFHLLVRVMLGVPLQDIDCGFRIVKRETVEAVLPEVESLPFSFWAEFTILAFHRGFRILEVPVSHRRRLRGGSSIYQADRLPRIILSQTRGLFRLRRRIRLFRSESG